MESLDVGEQISRKYLQHWEKGCQTLWSLINRHCKTSDELFVFENKPEKQLTRELNSGKKKYVEIKSLENKSLHM